MLALVSCAIFLFGCFFFLVSSQLDDHIIKDQIQSSSKNLETSTNSLSKTSQSDTFSVANGITNAENQTQLIELTTEKLKKRKGNKRKRHRKRRKNVAGILATTEQNLINKIENTTNFKPIHRRSRRRKLRKLKEKLVNETNILEITNAQGIPKIKTNFEITENEIVQSPNRNSEQHIKLRKRKRKKIKSDFSSGNNSSANQIIDGAQNNDVIHFTNITLQKNVSRLISRRHKKRYKRCLKKNGGCSQICNPKGSQKCSCLTGFALRLDGKTCDDIDECKINNGHCQTKCLNNLGSYECRCSTGFRLAYDMKSCIDINECLLRNGHGPCQDTCKNTFGSYICSCANLRGTRLSKDRETCEDLDECLEKNGGCSHDCINVFGKVFCSCPEGWELSTDWKTCQDINECEQDNLSDTCNHTCINTEGSFKCLESFDMINDQVSSNVCKPLFPPKRGFITCSTEGSFTFYTRNGRKRFTNSVGTNCKLVCPTGFKMVGGYDLTCGISGEWLGDHDAKCLRSSPPTLKCPPNGTFTMKKGTTKAMVRFPPPLTNLNWKFVKSKPVWAKNLEKELPEGKYEIMFLAKDPKNKLLALCTFHIVVLEEEE